MVYSNTDVFQFWNGISVSLKMCRSLKIIGRVKYFKLNCESFMKKNSLLLFFVQSYFNFEVFFTVYAVNKTIDLFKTSRHSGLKKKKEGKNVFLPF